MNFRVRRLIRRDHGIGISVDEDYSGTPPLGCRLYDGHQWLAQRWQTEIRLSRLMAVIATATKKNDNPDQPVKENPPTSPLRKGFCNQVGRKAWMKRI